MILCLGIEDSFGFRYSDFGFCASDFDIRISDLFFSMVDSPIQLSFEGGTLVLVGADPTLLANLPGCRLDPRTNQFRAEVRWYRALVEHLRQQKIAYHDAARNYEPLELKHASERTPFPHQSEALDAWWRGGGAALWCFPRVQERHFLPCWRSNGPNGRRWW